LKFICITSGRFDTIPFLQQIKNHRFSRTLFILVNKGETGQSAYSSFTPHLTSPHPIPTYPPPEVGKVSLKINGDEALSDESV
jgi:hypothetical protein